MAHYLLENFGILPDEVAAQSYRSKLFCIASIDIQREIREKQAKKAKNANRNKRNRRNRR